MKAPLFAVSILATAIAAYATKPCPPRPCSSLALQWGFDRKLCNEKADWIATGHVTHLVHHPAPYPLLKDFAEFTFVVDGWIKGGERLPKEIPFRVGWCTNAETLHGDGNGTFVFWGKNKPDLPGAEWEYLYFEAVK